MLTIRISCAVWASVSFVVCALIPTSASGVADVETQTEQTLMESLRETVGRLMDSSSSQMARQILEVDISSSCSIGLLKLMRGIRRLEPWAMRMIDSTGKFPTGFIQGSQGDLGAFDECVETVDYDHDGNEKIRLQYCSVYLGLGNDTSVIDAMTPAMIMSHARAAALIDYTKHPNFVAINMGLCIISDCSREDIQAIAEKFAGNKIKVHVRACQTSQYPPPDNIQRALIILLEVLVFFTVACTIYDYILFRRGVKAEARYTGIASLLTLFSVIASARTLLRTNQDKSSDSHKLRFLHGLRFFSALWVTFGHGFLPLGNNSGRRMNVLRYHDHFQFCIGTAGFLAVDTFFFISGFLMTYIIFPLKANRVLIAVLSILRRHIRVTIPIFFVIGFFYLVPLIVAGPGVIEMMDKFYTEVNEHWFTLLLEVRNFWKEIDTGSFQHLWYVSTDFQLFLVGLLVVLTLRGRPGIMVGVFAALSLAGCSFSAWQMYDSIYYPFPTVLGDTYEAVSGTFNDVYVMPTYHAVCYFSGCITLLMWKRYSGTKISWVTTTLMWTVAFTCCLAAIFMKYDWNRGQNPKGSLPKMVFAFFHNILWSIFLSFTVFICATGRGGPLRKLLSWNAFVPLSKLTLGVYVMHLPLYTVIYSASRERVYYSALDAAVRTAAVVCLSFALSCWLFVMCEVPTARLDKMLFAMCTPKQPVQEKAIRDEVNGTNGFLNPDVKFAGDCLPRTNIENANFKNSVRGPSIRL